MFSSNLNTVRPATELRTKKPVRANQDSTRDNDIKAKAEILEARYTRYLFSNQQNRNIKYCNAAATPPAPYLKQTGGTA